MIDLRSFLADEARHIWRPDGPVSLVQEITALQVALETEGRQPVIMIDKLKRADGAHRTQNCPARRGPSRRPAASATRP